MGRCRSVTILMLAVALCGSAAEPNGAGGKVVAATGFDGPYYRAGQADRIQKGCVNNYSWGKKDILITPDRPPGANDAAQKIEIRGISNGALQFFCCSDGFPLKRSHWYRVSFRMRGTGGIGNVTAMIRKIGGPWTALVRGLVIQPTEEWQSYTFTGQPVTDIDRDFGVMFQTGFMGTLWLDDLVVEEFEANPDTAVPPAPPVLGNLFPRSSFEGRRDHLWASGSYAYADVLWKDPQHFRAEGGKVGRYCLGVPGGNSCFTRSYMFSVTPGHRYTFSAWLRGDKPDTQCTVGLHGKRQTTEQGKGLGGRGLTLGTEWQRYEVSTGKPIPEHVRYVFVSLTPRNPGTVFADGFQFEIGDKGTPYQPASPAELYVDMGQAGGNIVFWGEPLPLRLLAAMDAADAPATLAAELVITAFPDRQVFRRILELPVNRELQLPVDPPRNGLFRVTLKAVDPKLAAEHEMIAARLPRPRLVPHERSYFGTHATIRPFFIDYAHKIGMKWTRFHDATIMCKWSGAEPKRGEYRWYDEQIKGIRDGGLQILALPDRPPKWAQTDPEKTGNVIDVAAFALYCESAARHYRGLIDYWEMWNEPYMRGFFKGTPEQFAAVLDAGAAAIRRGNPDARIVGFCPELSSLNFPRKVAALTKTKVDVFSFHAYFQNVTGGGTADFAQELALLLKTAKQPAGIEAWNSEGTFGAAGTNSFYSFLGDPRVNEWGAAFGSRVWLSTAAAGFRKTFIYTLHQTDTIMYHGGYKTLINYDRSITPSAVATAVTAYCMDGMLPIACPKVNQGAAQYAFAEEGRTVWSTFLDPLAKQPVLLHVGKLPATWEVLDAMGNDPRRDGVGAVTLGLIPIFVRATDMVPARMVQTCNAALGPE
ncbi:MAG: hypothetical protein HN380_25575 [Victivallales bacterium]|nr:hypothetical protein [Victivallales bacterium]